MPPPGKCYEYLHLSVVRTNHAHSTSHEKLQWRQGAGLWAMPIYCCTSSYIARVVVPGKCQLPFYRLIIYTRSMYVPVLTFSTSLYIDMYLTLIPSDLSPKRDCGRKQDNRRLRFCKTPCDRSPPPRKRWLLVIRRLRFCTTPGDRFSPLENTACVSRVTSRAFSVITCDRARPSRRRAQMTATCYLAATQGFRAEYLDRSGPLAARVPLVAR